MTSERMQRRIDAFLEQTEAASDRSEWTEVAEKARAVLAIDTDIQGAQGFLAMAVANGIDDEPPKPASPQSEVPKRDSSITATPTFFASGRYGCGASSTRAGRSASTSHDSLLDRDVALEPKARSRGDPAAKWPCLGGLRRSVRSDTDRIVPTAAGSIAVTGRPTIRDRGACRSRPGAGREARAAGSE